MLSKLVVEVPLTVVQLLVGWMLTYLLMDLQGNYLQLVTAGFGLSMTSNSIALILGSALTDVKAVTEMSNLLFVPQILFAGFFVPVNTIPTFLRWAQYLCGLSYAVKLVYQVEFGPSLDSCRTSAAAAANCSGLLSSNGINTDRFWVSILCLFAVFTVARGIAGFILNQKAKSFY